MVNIDNAFKRNDAGNNRNSSIDINSNLSIDNKVNINTLEKPDWKEDAKFLIGSLLVVGATLGLIYFISTELSPRSKDTSPVKSYRIKKSSELYLPGIPGTLNTVKENSDASYASASYTSEHMSGRMFGQMLDFTQYEQFIKEYNNKV